MKIERFTRDGSQVEILLSLTPGDDQALDNFLGEARRMKCGADWYRNADQKPQEALRCWLEWELKDIADYERLEEFIYPRKVSGQ